jgi:hypothetical protein
MPASKTFARYAMKCLAEACKTSDQKQKAFLIEMAGEWQRLGQQATRRATRRPLGRAVISVQPSWLVHLHHAAPPALAPAPYGRDRIFSVDRTSIFEFEPNLDRLAPFQRCLSSTNIL